MRIEQPSIGLAKGAELGLKVIVERKEGFEGAVYLEMDWLPSGVTKQITPHNSREGNSRLLHYLPPLQNPHQASTN